MSNGLRVQQRPPQRGAAPQGVENTVLPRVPPSRSGPSTAQALGQRVAAPPVHQECLCSAEILQLFVLHLKIGLQEPLRGQLRCCKCHCPLPRRALRSPRAGARNCAEPASHQLNPCHRNQIVFFQGLYWQAYGCFSSAPLSCPTTSPSSSSTTRSEGSDPGMCAGSTTKGSALREVF